MEKPLVIVGGGPSASDCDFETLKGAVTVATVNDGFRKLPWADICITADGWWLQKRALEIQRFRGRVIAILPKHLPDRPCQYERVERVSGVGFDGVPGRAHFGDNSGFAALNWAVAEGFKRIALIGFDYNPQGGHWHGGYEWHCPIGPERYPAWSDAMATVAPLLKKAGAKIVNCNPKSLKGVYRHASVEGVIGGDAWA